MKLKTCMLAALIGTGALFAASDDATKAQIKKLEQRRDGLEARAKQADHDADRLMTSDRTMAKARERDALHCRRQIIKTNEEIKELKKK